ncbi:MAG: sensor histidine kinase [Chloroflexota bacterium]
MNSLAEFFLQNISVVFFFYGLSFFSMGLAVWLEAGRASELDFAQALRPLAGFGLVHGGHEWFEMLLLDHPEIAQDPANAWIGTLRILLLSSSFLMLVAFGARLIAGPSRNRFKFATLAAVTIVWGLGLMWVLSTQAGGPERLVAADVYSRYSLAIPGATLTVWGLVLQRRKFIQAGMSSFGMDVLLAAFAFGLYGGAGQLFASPSAIFPSTYLNSDLFIRWFGFPVQVFRAVMACFAAIFIIRSLRAFEEENRRQIDSLREAQLAERSRLEAVRSELLHRTVKAQESERQRIARELHDETGQSLTALGMGLRALSETLTSNPERAVQQARQLEGLATSGLEELQRLISGLHPPQLEDLGLRAAIRWYAGEIEKRYSLPVTLTCECKNEPCPLEICIVVFRIAQEAITNTVRHANASRVSILIKRTLNTLYMRIEDDGQGFDIKSLQNQEDRPHWGLLGMQERAALIGGECTIQSSPGQGTLIEMQVSWEESR